jgi:hypothetical protein
MAEIGNYAVGCGVLIVIVCLTILLPLSFGYLDYWEYGLKQNKITGEVLTDQVYGKGRYLVGPNIKFFKYQADAHVVHLEDVAVFSNGGDDSVGLTFQIDVDFTYFLIKEEIGQLHQDLARTYESVVLSRTTDAIKNTATQVSFQDYFQERNSIEQKLKDAIQIRWNDPPSLHATLDQLHLGRIIIPDVVAEKQLTAKIQVETNRKEEFLQSARVEREITAVEVNTINLEKNKLLRETEAEANLIRANAVSEGEKIKSNAINTGTKQLLTSVGISSQEYSTAYSYLRTLQNRNSLDMKVSYLADENIVKTIAG